MLSMLFNGRQQGSTSGRAQNYDVGSVGGVFSTVSGAMRGATRLTRNAQMAMAPRRRGKIDLKHFLVSSAAPSSDFNKFYSATFLVAAFLKLFKVDLTEVDS